MIPQLHAMHLFAIQRGDGLRSEFFRHVGREHWGSDKVSVTFSSGLVTPANCNVKKSKMRRKHGVAAQI